MPKPAPVSGIDRFLQSQDDPNFRWRIMDERNGEEITLSRREVELLRRVQTNKFPHPEFNAYPVRGAPRRLALCMPCAHSCACLPHCDDCPGLRPVVLVRQGDPPAAQPDGAEAPVPAIQVGGA